MIKAGNIALQENKEGLSADCCNAIKYST